MEKTFKTFDGVEVSKDTKVWFCYKTGKDENIKDVTSCSKLGFFLSNYNLSKFYYFSTQEACQQYIDKMNQPVIFTTEDGVDMRVGDTYWAIDCDDNFIEGPADCCEDSGEDITCIYFSSQSKAQEYLDNLNKPVVFTTFDDTAVRLGDLYYCVANNCIYGPYVCNEHSSCNQDGPYFLTEEKAEKYINSLKLVEPIVTESSNMFLFEDALGQHVYENDTLYCCWKVAPVNTVHDVVIVDVVNRHTKLNPDFVYFKHKENCETYITNQKFESPELDGPIIIELSKSELEIAYDTLVALCAKYRQDNTTPQIDTLSHYPTGVTRYSILLVNGYGDPVFETNKMQFLDEAVIIVHAWLIQNHHFFD